MTGRRPTDLAVEAVVRNREQLARAGTDVRKCIITEETIREGRLPLLLTKTEVDDGVDETNYEEWLAARGESA